jgi:hypothetical protein
MRGAESNINIYREDGEAAMTNTTTWDAMEVLFKIAQRTSLNIVPERGAELTSKVIGADTWAIERSDQAFEWMSGRLEELFYLCALEAAVSGGGAERLDASGFFPAAQGVSGDSDEGGGGADWPAPAGLTTLCRRRSSWVHTPKA